MYNEVDWEKLTNRMREELVEVKINKTRWSVDEIDEKVAEIFGKIREVIRECVRKKKMKIGDTVELPKEVKGLMKRRKQAVKEKHRNRNRNPAWTTLLNEIIKETTAEKNEGIKKADAERLKARIQTVNTSRNTFKEIRSLSGKQRCTERQLIVANGRTATSA